MLQIGKYGKIKIAIWSHCPWLQSVVAVVAAAIGSEACLSQNHIYFFPFCCRRLSINVLDVYPYFMSKSITYSLLLAVLLKGHLIKKVQ